MRWVINMCVKVSNSEEYGKGLVGNEKPIKLVSKGCLLFNVGLIGIWQGFLEHKPLFFLG